MSLLYLCFFHITLGSDVFVFVQDSIFNFDDFLSVLGFYLFLCGAGD
jgi:hypothetical protein